MTAKSAPFAVNVYNIDYLTHLAQPDYDRLKGDLDKAAALDTDLVAVMIHWGAEYKTEQNRYQEDLADFLISHGADLVLGGHSHVPQPLELLTVTGEDGGSRSGFVCYSLGNFISAQNDPLTDTTAVLTLELTRDNITGETRVIRIFRSFDDNFYTETAYAPFFIINFVLHRPGNNKLIGKMIWDEIGFSRLHWL